METKIVKKLIVISAADIDYVNSVAKSVSDPRAIKPNFSKGLRHIISEHKKIWKAEDEVPQ